MVMSIIGWIVVGLVVGFVARMIHPGRDGMGTMATIVLGILGSLVGGAIAWLFHLGTSPYEPGGWILSIIGAILILTFTSFRSRVARA